MKTGIRTMSGVRFFINEMTRFEQISTNIVASPIDNPFMALVVVASVGHMPSMSTKVGFSFTMPLIIIFRCFISWILFYGLLYIL